MGNETFYCIQCGVRVSGVDVRGDRSHCPACLGLPVEPTPRPTRESSKRIRKPSSPALTAVAARPRTTDIVRPKTSSTLIVGALLFVGAVLLALTTFTFEKTDSSFSQPPAPQPVEKTNCLFSQDSAPPPPPPPTPPPQPTAPAPVDPAVETLGAEIEEAAAALADEGRFDDALARIRAFPAEHRQTRAWMSLQGLRRQIEARARAK